MQHDEQPVCTGGKYGEPLRRLRRSIRAVPPGAAVCPPDHRDASLFELLRGCCFFYLLHSDGGRQILHFALPGDVIEANPAGGSRSGYGLQAILHSVVKATGKQQLDQIEIQDPEAALALWRRAAFTRRLALDRLQSLSGESAGERVAHLLIEFCVRVAGTWPIGEVQATVPLHQEHIADATAMTREHVSRTLGSFARSGLLTYRGGTLAVLDTERLLEVAKLDERAVALWLDRPMKTTIMAQQPKPGGRNFVRLANDRNVTPP